MVCSVVLTAILVTAAAGYGATPPPSGPPGPGAGMGPQLRQPAGEPHASPLDLLAAQPGRLAWGPLPILRGQRALLTLTRQALHYREPLVRRRGLMVLGLLELPEAVPSLVTMQGDPVREVRLQAAVSLALLGDARGLFGCREALVTGPDWLRFYAIHGLWRLGGLRATRLLDAARPQLSPFLQKCTDEALADDSRPPRVRPAAAASGGAPPQNLEGLWGYAADALIGECDWWWHKGDYEQCIRSQEVSLFFDPHNVDGYTNVAWLQWSLGRQGEAVATYHRCLRDNPTSWEAADALGTYYRQHKQLDLAAKYYALAAKLGSPPLFRRQWGHVLEALGRNDEARAAWQQILKLDPNDPIALRQLQRLGGP
jgi:hypothetical protein